MPTSGESLKQEREAQEKTLEEMAEATGIRLDFLAALEQDTFEALPGRAFGKLYIRAYAEVLGFDPQPVIDAYDRAQNARPAGTYPSAPPTAPRPVEAALARWRRERMGEPELEEPEPEPEGEQSPEDPEPELEEPAEEPAVPEPEPDPFEARWARETWGPRERVAAPEPQPEQAPIEAPPAEAPTTEAWEYAEPEAAPPRAAPLHRRWLGVAALVLLLLAAGVVGISIRFRRAEASPPPAPTTQVPSPLPVKPAPPSTLPAPEPAPRRQPPPYTVASPSRLTVSEYGIGERDRFRPGQRVRFTTRVLGGRSGDRIRHVWIRDGKVEQSISLHVGASSYRTYSSKTLGRPGAWAVEARDDAGRVLARAEFTCAP